MLETSTNGARAAAGDAAGGREDQGGVAELGFVAAARAAPAGVPDPELVEQAKRRKFTAKYKLEILERAEACTRPGEVGELLRREGLYTSHLTYWRKQVKDGALKELGMSPGTRLPNASETVAVAVLIDDPFATSELGESCTPTLDAGGGHREGVVDGV
jgi:transposase-like protein